MKARVTIITPTTGSPLLRQCMLSVRDQSYPNIEHLVVVDGPKRARSACRTIRDFSSAKVIQLSNPTGLKGFQGHRVYASAPLLVNSEYICYLDEDNWLEKNHIHSLLRLVVKHGLSWAHSLRKIVRQNGTFVCNDDCNSLGRWPSYDGGYHHVDTSCYMIRRDVACQLTEEWNRSDEAGIGAADRIVCKALISRFPLFHTTGLYTLNYRLGSRQPERHALRFYLSGNEIQSRIYRLPPWKFLRVAGRNSLHPHLDFQVSKRDEKLIGGPLHREAKVYESSSIDMFPDISTPQR